MHSSSHAKHATGTCFLCLDHHLLLELLNDSGYFLVARLHIVHHGGLDLISADTLADLYCVLTLGHIHHLVSHHLHLVHLAWIACHLFLHLSHPLHRLHLHLIHLLEGAQELLLLDLRCLLGRGKILLAWHSALLSHHDELLEMPVGLCVALHRHSKILHVRANNIEGLLHNCLSSLLILHHFFRDYVGVFIPFLGLEVLTALRSRLIDLTLSSLSGCLCAEVHQVENVVSRHRSTGIFLELVELFFFEHGFKRSLIFFFFILIIEDVMVK